MKEFLTIRDFFYRYRYRYLWGILALIGADVMQILTPKVMGWFTDDLVDGGMPLAHVMLYGGGILLIGLLTALFRYSWRMNLFGAARYLETEMREKLFAHYLKLSPEFYTRHRTGDLMAHATNDIQAVRMSVGVGVMMLMDSFFLILMVTTMMAWSIDWKLTVAALLPLPFMAVVTARFGSSIRRRFQDAQAAFADLTNTVQENLSGIRVVKGFVQEESEIRKFDMGNEQTLQKNLRLVRLQSFFQPLVQMITGLSFLISLSYGGTLAIQGVISLGDFVAFNTYLGLLIWPMMALGWVVNNLQQGAASLARLNRLFAAQPEVADDPEKTLPISRLEGEIEVKNLSFRYPGTDKEVLHNLSFHLRKGQTLGIVGKSGSGKSTLANLLVRLWNAPEGSIFMDGHDIRQIPLSTLRKEIGYVPQDHFLFSETLSWNIAFGSDGATPEDIEQAAEDAHVKENILAFPRGFDTVVGERGVTLSGGQKQRISIARAILKNPPILILDDCLSAVDSRTEKTILNRLKRLRAGKTNIIIAHRISTLMHADWILVLDEGRVVEAGTHEELLELGGLYARMYFQQALEAEIANP